MRECSVETKRGEVCLPDLVPCENPAEWNTYLHDMYNKVFVPNFLNSCPTFNGWNVLIRKEPRDEVWEHGFTHMMHEDYLHASLDPNERIPDFRRTERLGWVRTIIEKYKCSVQNTEWALAKRLRKHEQYQKQKTPLA